jgi:hypothetical protein
MNVRLLEIFRRRASKEICLRRQPGNRYQVVCPIEERYSLGVFFREWVPISSEKASINWNKVTPNHRTMGYKDMDRYEVPYKNSFLRLEEARAELTKIRRGYIIHHLVPELCQKLPVNK